MEDGNTVRNIFFATGKIYFDLISYLRREYERPKTAATTTIVRCPVRSKVDLLSFSLGWKNESFELRNN
jgi:hypothetical protein